MPNNDEKKVLLKVTDLKQLVLLENPDVENQHLEELYFRSTNRQKVRQCITAELLPIWHRFM